MTEQGQGRAGKMGGVGQGVQGIFHAVPVAVGHKDPHAVRHGGEDLLRVAGPVAVAPDEADVRAGQLPLESLRVPGVVPQVEHQIRLFLPDGVEHGLHGPVGVGENDDAHRHSFPRRGIY